MDTKPKQFQKQESEYEHKLIRILSTDIPGDLKLYVGLTKIKGISWAMSNATCMELGFDKTKKIGALTEQEIEKISNFIKKPKLPNMIFNRKFDAETGENRYIIGTELELQKEFDIKKLKKMKSYRGLRHQHGQPSRGQRTKAHFRSNRKKGVGIKRKDAISKKPMMNKGGRK